MEVMRILYHYEHEFGALDMVFGLFDRVTSRQSPHTT
jgi:hypothetical protein